MSDTPPIDPATNTNLDTPPATPPTDPNTPPGITQQAHETALAAAREDARKQEKQKLYATQVKDRERIASFEASSAAKDAEIAQLAAKLEEMSNSNLSEQEKIQRQLEKVTAENAKIQDQLQEVATQAAKRITESEQRAYRDRRLRESGIQLTELVPAIGTAEDIDAAIETALKQEQKIYARAEEKIRAEHAKNVPTPISPELDPAKPGLLQSMDRRDVAKLKGSEYKKVRQRLLDDAMKRVSGGRT